MTQRRHTGGRRWLLGPTITALLLTVVAPAAGSEAVPKQVHLIVQAKTLVASNVRFSRFDELKLSAQEQIEKQAEGEAVIIVVTNQRILAYGVMSGWRSMRTEAGEQVESITVQDFAALVMTDTRYLNFNGQTGIWGEQDQRIER